MVGRPESVGGGLVEDCEEEEDGSLMDEGEGGEGEGEEKENEERNEEGGEGEEGEGGEGEGGGGEEGKGEGGEGGGNGEDNGEEEGKMDREAEEEGEEEEEEEENGAEREGEKIETAGDQKEVGRKEKCNEAEDREDGPSNVDEMDVGAAAPTTPLDTEGNGVEETAGPPARATASTSERHEATVEVGETFSGAPVTPSLDPAILQGKSATVAEVASSRSQPESGTSINDKPMESSENVTETASTQPTTLDNQVASRDESATEDNKKPPTATISQPAIEPETEEDMQRETDTKGKPEGVDEEERLVTVLAAEVKETPKQADSDVKTIDSHVECETAEIEQGSGVEMPGTDVTSSSPDLVKIISPKTSFLPPSLSPNPQLPLSSLTRTRRNTKCLDRVEQFDMTPVVLELRETITTDTKGSRKKSAAKKKSSKSMKSSHMGDDLARRPKVVEVSGSELPKSRKQQKERSHRKDSKNADIETAVSREVPQ